MLQIGDLANSGPVLHHLIGRTSKRLFDSSSYPRILSVEQGISFVDYFKITSVSSFLLESRNTVLSIPNISEEEKLDRFVAGLKQHIRLEVLKSSSINLESASTITIHVNSAIYGTGIYERNRAIASVLHKDPKPMAIGDVNGSVQFRGKSFNSNRTEMSHHNGRRIFEVVLFLHVIKLDFVHGNIISRTLRQQIHNNTMMYDMIV